MDSKQKPKRNNRRHYRPVSPETWARLVAYLEQAERHHRDPSAPEPDIALLADAEHGPLLDIVPGKDGAGRLGLFFQVQLRATKPRHAPALVVLMMRLHLAFGVGAHVNNNGTGWSGVRLGSGNCKPMLLRLVLDAKPGEIVRQRRGVPFRVQNPANFIITGIERFRAEGKKTRFPAAGRPEMIAHSLDRFRRFQPRSGIAITEREYEAVLRRVYALIDATFNVEEHEVA